MWQEGAIASTSDFSAAPQMGSAPITAVAWQRGDCLCTIVDLFYCKIYSRENLTLVICNKEIC